MIDTTHITGTYIDDLNPVPVSSVEPYVPKITPETLRARAQASLPNNLVDYVPLPYDHLNVPVEEEMGEFRKGLNRGWESTQATLYGAVGAVGDLLNIPDLAEWGYHGYLRNMEEAEQYKAKVGSFTDIDSFGSAGDYIAGKFGELLPSVATSLASGGVGGAAAKTVGARLLRKQVDKKIKDLAELKVFEQATKGAINKEVRELATQEAQKAVIKDLATKGGMYAMAFATSMQEGGGNWGQDAFNHGLSGTSPGMDMLFGIASGVSEIILGAEVSLFKAVTGKTVSDAVEKSFRRELARGLPKAMASEGGQEAFQELLSTINANIQDSKGLITVEDLEGIADAAIAGAIGGGAFHTPTLLATLRNTKKKTDAQKQIEETASKIEDNKKKPEADFVIDLTDKVNTTAPLTAVPLEERIQKVQNDPSLTDTAKELIIRGMRSGRQYATDAYREAIIPAEEERPTRPEWTKPDPSSYYQRPAYSLAAEDREEEVQRILNNPYLKDTEKERIVREIRSGVRYPQRDVQQEQETVDPYQATKFDVPQHRISPYAQMRNQHLNPDYRDSLNKAKEKRATQAEMWQQYVDEETKRFNEEWDAKEKQLRGMYQQAQRAAGQADLSANAGAIGAPTVSRNEAGITQAQAIAEYAQYQKERKEAWEKKQAEFKKGFVSADGTLISEAKIASSEIYQKKQIDSALGKGTFDNISGALTDASTYYSKIRTALSNRVARINEEISRVENALAEEQKNLTLTSEKWKQYQARLKTLTKLRGETLRSTRKINTLMGKIAKQNADLANADLNELMFNIQEMYHEGDTILGYDRQNDIYYSGQADKAQALDSQFDRTKKDLQRASKEVEKARAVQTDETTHPLGGTVVRQGNLSNLGRMSEVSSSRAQAEDNVLSNLENYYDSVVPSKDMPIAPAPNNVPSSVREEQQAAEREAQRQDDENIASLNATFTAGKQNELQRRMAAREAAEQERYLNYLLATTGQKVGDIPPIWKTGLEIDAQRKAHDDAFVQEWIDNQQGVVNTLTVVLNNKRDTAQRAVVEQQAQEAIAREKQRLQEKAKSAEEATRAAEEEQENQRNIATSLISKNEARNSVVSTVVNFLQNTLNNLPGLKDNTVICYDENDASVPLELRNMIANVKLGLSKGVKYLFCGTNGTYNLDISGEMYTRADNYLTAELMEAEGKDPRAIKLATGWERNKADGMWRYEIDDKDFTFDSSIPELNDVDAFNNKGYTLADVLANAEQLFIAYPELKDYKVSLMKFDGSTRGSFNTSTKKIELADALSTSEKTLTLLHEIQHAIQSIEGFNSGTNDFAVSWNRSNAKGYYSIRTKRMRSLYNMYSMHSDWALSSINAVKNKFNDIFSKIKDEKLALNEEIYSDLTALSEGLSKLDSLDREALTSLMKLSDKLVAAIEVFRKDVPYFEQYEYSQKLISLQSGIKAHISNRITRLLKDVDKANRLKNIFKRFKDYADPNLYQDSFTVYKRRAGETEARNVQTRHGLSYEERLKSLIEDTQDIAYEDQQTMYRAMNGRAKGVYYKGKLYIFANNMEGKQDAIRTLIHEGVAHYGLRSIMTNEQLGYFLDLVYNSFANTDVWQQFLKNRPAYASTDRVTMAEEFVAYVAENMHVSELLALQHKNLYQRIILFLRNVLSKLGLGQQLTLDDVRDVLKLSAYNLSKRYNKERNDMSELGQFKTIKQELSSASVYYDSSKQVEEKTLEEEPIYGVKFDDVNNARVFFANADAARSGVPYTRFAKNDPNLSNTLNLNDPLNGQSDKIKERSAKLLRALGIAPSITKTENGSFVVQIFGKPAGQYSSYNEARASVAAKKYMENITGWDLYNALASRTGSKRSATEVLNHYGIRGAQYISEGKNNYYLFEGNNLNTVPYEYNLDTLSEPKFLITPDSEVAVDPETGEPTTKDTEDERTFMEALYSNRANQTRWLARMKGVWATGKSRADDGTLIEHSPWERFMEGVFDQYRRLKAVQDYLKDNFPKVVDYATNVYQNLQGLTNRIRREQTDNTNKYFRPITKILKSINVPITLYDKNGKEIEVIQPGSKGYDDAVLACFDDFLRARHAAERNASVSNRMRGIRWTDEEGNKHHKNKKTPEDGMDIINASGMSDATAARLIDLLGSIPGFQEAASKVDEMNRFTLQEMLRNKLITDEDYANMAKYNYYVPLRGWEEMIEVMAPGRYRPRGRSLSTGGKPVVRTARGRDNKLPESPLLRSWQQMEDIIAVAHRNEVMRGLGELVKRTQDDTDLWSIDTKKPEDLRIQKMADGTLGFFVKPSEYHGSGLSSVTYFDENGKPVRIVIKDPWLASCLRGENISVSHPILDFMRKYTGLMSQLMTSKNPAFILTNPVRDLGSAYLNLGSVVEENEKRGLIEALSSIQNGVLKDVTSGKHFKLLKAMALSDRAVSSFNEEGFSKQDIQDLHDWRANGGHTTSLEVHTLKERYAEVRKSLRKDGTTKQWAKAAWEYLDALSDVSENMTRFAVYQRVQRAFEENIKKRAEAEGWTKAQIQEEINKAKQKSANISLDCTVNFTKRGAWANTYNPLFAFSSASLQSFARIARNLWRPTSTPQQNFKRVAKFLAFGTASPLLYGTVARAIMGDDDDGINKYDKIPSYIKMSNLIIPAPFSDGGYIKVPLPYGYNTFWSAGIALDNMIHGNKSVIDCAADVAKTAISGVSPIDPTDQGAIAFVPTLFKPIFEIYANKTFSGSPIIPATPYADSLPDHMKSWEKTPAMYKEMAALMNYMTGGFMTRDGIGMIDVSPESIEHMLTGYFGGLYRVVEQTVTLAASPLFGYQTEAKNIPILNRAYGVTGDDNTRAIYNTYSDQVRVAKTMKKEFEGTPEEREYANSKRNALSLDKPLNAVTKQLNEIKDAKKKLAKRYPKKGEAYYRQLELINKREARVMAQFNAKAKRAGLHME